MHGVPASCSDPPGLVPGIRASMTAARSRTEPATMLRPARTCPDSFRASGYFRPSPSARVGDRRAVDGLERESGHDGGGGVGGARERRTPRPNGIPRNINSEAGFAGIKWDKWDSAGQATPALLCRGPMTLPSAHHGAIFAQAPRALHRTLVRGQLRVPARSRARYKNRRTPAGRARKGERARPHLSPALSAPRGGEGEQGWRRLRSPSALRVHENEQGPCHLRPLSALLRLRRRAKVAAACVPPPPSGEGDRGRWVWPPRVLGLLRSDEARITRFRYRRRTSAQESAPCPAVNS